MSKDPLYGENPTYMESLKACLSSTQFNKGRIGFPNFFIPFQTRNAHAAKMIEANTFEEIRAIAPEALQSEPRLGRNPFVRECYEIMGNSSSALEAVRNLSEGSPGTEEILGENTHRKYADYCPPFLNEYFNKFVENFGGRYECGLPPLPEENPGNHKRI